MVHDNTSVDLNRKKTLKTNADIGFLWLTQVLAVGVAVVLAWVVFQTAFGAWQSIGKFGFGFLTKGEWNPVADVYGILPQIYGTIVTSIVALLFAVPVGVAAAIFLSEDFLPKSISEPIVYVIELIVAIPSVVLGLWGIFILVPAARPSFTFLWRTLGWIPFFGGDRPRGSHLLLVGLVIAVMIVPIIITISRSTFQQLPPNLREGSLAMGATRWETILFVLLPAGLSGVISSSMLALGRAMGETMVAAMLSGNANRISVSWLQPGSTITGLIASKFGEAGREQISSLMYAGLILMAITLVINIVAQSLINKFQNVER